MMQVKDIPDELINRIRNQFEGDPRVRNMRAQQQLLIKNHQVMQAMQIGKTLEQLFAKVLNTYIDETEKDAERFDLNAIDMPEEDRKELKILVLTAFMACDMVETAAMDINDVIQRSDKTLVVDEFDELINLAKNARARLEHFSENSNYMKDMVWGYKCDNMFDMLKNKAESIFRRHAKEEESKKP